MNDSTNKSPLSALADGLSASSTITSGGDSAAAADPVEEVPGYKILGELGRGGMGVVYRARDVRLGRLVALKMVLAGAHAQTDDLLRFLTEAQSAAALQHPGIVQVHEIGQHKGLPYFTLEYVAGGSLAFRLSGQPQSASAAAALVEKLAHAVQVAHAAGILHRDLKPANVLIAETADTPLEHCTPKIADFGLAKRLDNASGLTQSGAILGTPSYMAPEQADGRSRDLGPAADIYSLGAILYEMLVGRPPFKAATPLETMLQVSGHEPVFVRVLQPLLPRDLETICHKCLRKDPARRYASAADLAEDLRRFRAGEPIAARPVGRWERAWRWCRRNKAVAVSLAAVATILLAATLVSVSYAVQAGLARREAEAREASEASARQEADATRRHSQRQLADQLAASGLQASRQGDHALAMLWFAQAIRAADEAADVEQLNRVRLSNWQRQVATPVSVFTVPGFRPSQDQFTAFHFSPDGRHLLVLAAGKLLVWERDKGQTLTPAQGAVSAAAWEPITGNLALCQQDGIHIWDPVQGSVVEKIAHADSCTCLAFSANGRWLAAGGSGGVSVWDRRAEKPTAHVFPHARPVVACSFSAAGQRLVTTAQDRGARIFALPPTGTEPLFPAVAQTLGETGVSHGGVEAVAPRFIDNDTHFVTCNRGVLSLRDAVTGKPVLSYQSPPDLYYVRATALSPDGKFLALTWENSGRLMSLQTRNILAAVPQEHYWCEDAVFTPDGAQLVTCGQDTTVRFWNVEKRTNFALEVGAAPLWHPVQVVRVRIDPQGRFLATAQWDGTVTLWRLPPGPAVAFRESIGAPAQAAVSADGKFVLSRSTSFYNAAQKTVQVLDARTGSPVGAVLDPGGVVLDAVFSPDGRWVATASSTASSWELRRPLQFDQDKGGVVTWWDWRTGQRLAGPVATPGEPRGLAVSPDGGTLAAVCADYRVALLAAPSGELRRVLDPGTRTQGGSSIPNLWWSNGEARFSSDGRSLVTWEKGELAHVWELPSGVLRHTLTHRAQVQHATFHPTQPNVLATAGRDSLARVWDVASGKRLAELPHPRFVTRVYFGPNEELLTGCDDGLLRTWDWSAGRVRHAWPLHSHLLNDFAFTADRRWLVSVAPGQLLLTDAATGLPAGPLWTKYPETHLNLALAGGDTRAIIGGFSRSLIGLDLETLTAPLQESVDDLQRRAELLSGRKVLGQGTVVPLRPEEWRERWEWWRRR